MGLHQMSLYLSGLQRSLPCDTQNFNEIMKNITVEEVVSVGLHQVGLNVYVLVSILLGDTRLGCIYIIIVFLLRSNLPITGNQHVQPPSIARSPIIFDL